MKRPLYLNSILLLLATASLAVATPLTQPSAPAPAKTANQTIPDGEIGDGHVQTVKMFRYYVEKAAEIQSMLEGMRAAAVTRHSGDTAKQQEAFLSSLVEEYPGSTFDGSKGSVKIQEGYTALFNNSLKVESIKVAGKTNREFLTTKGRILLTDMFNSVTILVDQNNPSGSSFSNVSIPSIKNRSEAIVTDPDRKRLTADSPETVVLNDAYRLISLTTNLSMDNFASDIMRSRQTQLSMLKSVANGFRERHQGDYEAADPAKIKKKTVEIKPDNPGYQMFSDTFIVVFIFILFAAGVFCVYFFGKRSLKSKSQDPEAKKSHEFFSSLSPMVNKCLKTTGVSLWGRNLPWSKKYYIYERADRWILCDGIEDRSRQISQALTRLEVGLRSSYFKLRITRLNGAGTNIWIDTHDFSAHELAKGLEKLSRKISNPSPEDDDMAEEEMMPAATSGSPPPPPIEAVAQPAVPAPAPDSAPLPEPAAEAAPEVTAPPVITSPEPAVQAPEEPVPPPCAAPEPDSTPSPLPETSATNAPTEPAPEAEQDETEESSALSAEQKRRRPPKKSLLHPQHRPRR